MELKTYRCKYCCVVIAVESKSKLEELKNCFCIGRLANWEEIRS